MKERNTVDFGVPFKRFDKKRKKPLTINFSYFIILAHNRESVKSKTERRGIFSARKGVITAFSLTFFINYSTMIL